MSRVAPLRLLIIGQREDWPLSVRELAAGREIEILTATSTRHARDPNLLEGVDAVLICSVPADLTIARHELQLLADALLSHRLAAVVLSACVPAMQELGEDALVPAGPEISADELWGRLITIRQYRPMLRRMESQVNVMQRLGKKLNQQFVEVDQELRLASRLQRDFLPKNMPRVGDIRFAALFRPATWVSGDIYDVRRLDESHLSFYLADAVGHGVAAGLLTMFIRQAVTGKHVGRDRYKIIPPDQVLAHLNTQLAQQELPNCQFVTACYGTIDSRTHEVAFSRGGHPHPLLAAPDGTCTEIRTVGGLLGVFPAEQFPSTRVHIKPGEKFIIYSDGLEDVIFAGAHEETENPKFNPAFRAALAHPADQCIAALTDLIEHAEGSLQPSDDQTCIVLERLPDR